MKKKNAESALFTMTCFTFFLKKIRQKGKFSVTSGRFTRYKYSLWIWWVEWVARVEWVEWVVWVVWRMFMLSLFGFAPFPLPGPTLYPTVGPISPSTSFFASSDSSKSLYIISHKLYSIHIRAGKSDFWKSITKAAAQGALNRFYPPCIVNAASDVLDG